MLSIYKWVSKWNEKSSDVITKGSILFYLAAIFATVWAPKGFLRTFLIQFVIITVLSFLSYAVSIKLEDWDVVYELTNIKKIMFVTVIMGCAVTLCLHILINGISIFDFLVLIQFTAVLFNSFMLGIDIHTALIHNPISEGKIKRLISIIIFSLVNFFIQLITVIADGVSDNVIDIFVAAYLITLIINGSLFLSGLIKFLLGNIQVKRRDSFKSKRVNL